MRKLLSSAIIFVFAVAVMWTAPVQAFLPKNDVAKTPANITKMVAKVKENVEKGIEWVSKSKMGKLVGAGIEQTKKGMEFAKNAYRESAKLYDQGMEYVNDAKNSKAYKAAVISKQIARESDKLRKMMEEKLKEQEKIKQKLEVAALEIQSKQTNALKNDYYRQKSAHESSGEGNADEGPYSFPPFEEFAEKHASENNTVQELQAALNAQTTKMELQFKLLDDDFADKIAAQTSKIADLTKQLGELSGVKVSAKDPVKAIQDARETIFLKPGQEPTIRNINVLQEQRFAARREIIYETYRKALLEKAELVKSQEEVEIVNDLVDAMPSESDASGVQIEILIRQAKMLRRYLDTLLNDLIHETAVEVAKYPQTTSERMQSKFRLCDYVVAEPKKNGLGGLGGALSALKSGGGNILDSAKSLKKQASGVVTDVKSKAADIKSKADDVKQMKNDIKDVSGSIKDMMKSDPEGTLTGLGGMI